jgi:hypothetical protein
VFVDLQHFLNQNNSSSKGTTSTEFCKKRKDLQIYLSTGWRPKLWISMDPIVNFDEVPGADGSMVD